MYLTKKETKKFNTEVAEDLREYDEILNDPLCTIISEHKEKLNETDYDEETGKPIRSVDKIVLVVTWEEKYLP